MNFPLFGAVLVLSSALGSALAEEPIRIRVDPARRDGRQPATVEAALAMARAAVRPVGRPLVIAVPPGRHELAAPLDFGPEDSGITIEGEPGDDPPTLSGGTRITGWRRSATNRQVWEVVLPEVAAGRWYFHQLFLDGARAQRARTPNTGFFRAAAPLSTTSPIELRFRDDDLRPAWAGLPDARLVMLAKWTDLHLPILSVDPAAHVARMPGGPRPYWMDEKDARYWVENVPDALDTPGEWYLDRATGLLRFWVPKGEDPNRAQVVAPRLAELVRWHGSADGKVAVHDVTLRHLRFADADLVMPPNGTLSPQAAVDVHGTLVARHARHCRIADCRFESMGGYGLELGRGCQGWTVEHCSFWGLGAGGLRIGDPGDREPSAHDANHSHRILDNRLEHLGRVFPPAVGILVFHSGTNRIAHNLIRDLYYTAISVGWNWGYQSTPCRANEVDHNRVELVGQGMLSDMGGIYTLGPQPGTRIHHNLFADIRSHDYGGWGLYTDEGSTGIVVEDNVAVRCKSAGFHQHYGRDNVVRNNLIVANTEHSLMRTRVEDHRSFWFTNNVVVLGSGNVLGSDWRGSTNQVWLDGNLYWDTRHGTNVAAYRFGKETWDAWSARGLDAHSVIADPLLVDPDHPELGLRPGSPAFALGFRQIDLHDLGPRP